MKNIKENDRVCAHILVSGRVQGVAFRYYARNMAYQLGVGGWIKNLANGQVELVVDGSKNSVNEMIEWCKQGPRMAQVENVEVDWLPCSVEYSHFQVKM
ncbi:MAG: acylphosphatase [Atribacterota bacterium]